MKPRIIVKINRQMVPPIMAILALEDYEGHPSAARACTGALRPGNALVHKPQVQRYQPPTLVLPLPGPDAMDLGLIPSSSDAV